MSQETSELLNHFDEAGWELHTIRDFIRFSVSVMNSSDIFLGHGTDDVFAEATALVMHNLNLVWDADEEIMDARLLSIEKKAVLAMLKRRVVERIPVAYLTNVVYFCEMPFYVDARVLIPRSPIAELIRDQFEPWIEEAPETILDLCTGSGCIAIALAETFDDAMVDAVDISGEALEVAQLNVETHEVDDRVMLIQSDLFAQIGDQSYDLIVCNPPYVSSGSMAELPQEYSYEPDLALEGGRDGLDLIRRILAEAADHLNEGGSLVLEVGESRWSLEQEFPDFEFNWLLLESDAEGVVILSVEDLLLLRTQLSRKRR